MFPPTKTGRTPPEKSVRGKTYSDSMRGSIHGTGQTSKKVLMRTLSQGSESDANCECLRNILGIVTRAWTTRTKLGGAYRAQCKYECDLDRQTSKEVRHASILCEASNRTPTANVEKRMFSSVIILSYRQATNEEKAIT